jgi:AraC family transcriptional regulator
MNERHDPKVKYVKLLSVERQRRVLDFIEKNISRPIRLEDLAATAALSPYHFVRLFRKSVGTTPVRFVWQRRIEHAKMRLHHLEIPIGEIASDCGFSSQSHFTTVFKRKMGITPMEYRQQAK